MRPSCATAPSASSDRASKIKSRYVRRRIAPFRFGQGFEAGAFAAFRRRLICGPPLKGSPGGLSPAAACAVMVAFMAVNGRPDSGDHAMTKRFALVALALCVAGAPALAY